jgi:hypothetical protein
LEVEVPAGVEAGMEFEVYIGAAGHDQDEHEDDGGHDDHAAVDDGHGDAAAEAAAEAAETAAAEVARRGELEAVARQDVADDPIFGALESMLSDAAGDLSVTCLGPPGAAKCP